ncbi:hypothetical protein PGQ11_002355 [Apiospora arundinis]|uniref:Uncharacterized protein n=1 Tax=Apiospora arundinis TaxID=335852 RepID=A0ABR2JIA3_9PEZI
MATTQAQQPLPATAAAATTTAAPADEGISRRDSPAYTEEQRAALAAAVAQAEAGGSGDGGASSTTGRPSVETTYTTNTESPLLSGGGDGEGSERLRKYNMYYTTSRLSVFLHRGKRQDAPAEYFMQSDVLALKKPQLLLRRQTSDSTDKDGPVVAWGKLKLFSSRHCTIGLGDPTSTAATISSEGIKLHRDKNFIHRSDWRFSTDVGSPHASNQIVEYVWRKDMAKYGATIYKCVQEGHEDKVYARLLSGGGLNGKKGGEVMVREGLDSGLEALLLVSAQTIWAWEALDYQSLRQGYTSNSKSDKSKSD